MSTKISTVSDQQDMTNCRVETFDDDTRPRFDGSYGRGERSDCHREDANRVISRGDNPGRNNRQSRPESPCLVGQVSETVCIAPVRTIMFRPRVSNVAAVTCNDKEITLELHYNADTSVLGNVALVVADFDEPVNVQGHDPVLGTKTYQNITGAVGYYDPLTRNSFHILIHQAIHIPTHDHHLLCPTQCCVACVDIND